MINFFRKIRKKLADDNKPLKYIRYAVGEILLVVIGILIALQINNWNEERQDLQKGIKILEELANNIAYNNKNIESYIRRKDYYDKYTDYVTSVLEGAVPYSDSLDNILNRALYNRNNFVFSVAAYESLKNMGFEFIGNDELKKEIIDLFDEEYTKVRNAFVGWTSTARQADYIDQHFLPISTGNGLILKPYDFSIQMRDPYFMSIIQKAKNQRDFYASRLHSTLEESQVVLQHLMEELNGLD